MKIITFDNPHRRRHFEFFRSMNHPHFCITANVDITRFLAACRQNGWPFMASMAWLISRAANEVPQLRQRIRGEQVVEHEVVHPSFTVSTEVADVFSFCEVSYHPDFSDFLSRAVAKTEEMRTNPSFADEADRDDYLFLSSLPWVSFTAVQHAMQFHPHDSVPRLTWGKYFSQNEKVLMPLSAQAHHALVDGRHLGRFFQSVEAFCAQPQF